MIRNLIDAICLTLSENFNDYAIYTEEVEQNLKTPCFFVDVVNQRYQNWSIGLNNDRRNYNIVVQFFPDDESEEKRLDCLEMSETLQQQLLLIADNDKNVYISKNTSSKIIDNILHFFVTYSENTYTYDEDSETGIGGVDYMEELHDNIAAK